MASFDLPDRAAGEFETRLGSVTDAQRELPTPCSEYNVGVSSLTWSGMRITTLLLGGATRDEAVVTSQGDVLGSNWVEAFNDGYRSRAPARVIAGRVREPSPRQIEPFANDLTAATGRSSDRRSR